MIALTIDHHRARFFQSTGDGRFVEQGHLEPKDPHGFRRHLEHRKEADYRGQRVPEADEYYERIAQRLKGDSQVLLVGDATAKSSATEYLLAYLKEKHPDAADRVIGAEDADLSSLNLGDIERIARGYE